MAVVNGWDTYFHVWVGDGVITPYNPNAVPPLQYIAAGQSFQFDCTGLMPSTNHRVTVNNIDVTDHCKPAGGNIGDTIQTDSSGRITFYYYAASTINNTSSDLAQAQELLNQISSSLVFSIRNSSGTSSATATVSVVHIQKEVAPTTPTSGGLHNPYGWPE